MSETDPSRWMRNDTSAVSTLPRGGENRSATCRTMFCRYPGNGKSSPATCTLATSAPLPPSGPPPARGPGVAFEGAPLTGGAAFGFALLGGIGVERDGAGFALLGVGSAFAFGGVSARGGGGVTGAGLGGSGVAAGGSGETV